MIDWIWFAVIIFIISLMFQILDLFLLKIYQKKNASFMECVFLSKNRDRNGYVNNKCKNIFYKKNFKNKCPYKCKGSVQKDIKKESELLLLTSPFFLINRIISIIAGIIGVFITICN